MARDPVEIFRAALVNWGVMDRARTEQIEAEAKREAREAFAWADKQPMCKPEDGLKHVYVEGSVEPRQFA